MAGSGFNEYGFQTLVSTSRKRFIFIDVDHYYLNFCLQITVSFDNEESRVVTVEDLVKVRYIKVGCSYWTARCQAINREKQFDTYRIV